MIGYGGIILRNPSIVFKTWQLENVQEISLFLKTKFDIGQEQAYEFLSILWHLNGLVSAQSDEWSLDDIPFSDDCPILPLMRIEVLDLVDSLGSLPITSLLKLCYLHGQWDSLNHF